MSSMRTLKLPKEQRSPRDFYETPEWCTRALLSHPRVFGALLTGQPRFVDPCCGNGAIFRSLDTALFSGKIELADIDPGPAILDIATTEDFLGPDVDHSYRPSTFCLTNPPYSLAIEFVREACERYELTAMLLSLAFLESKRRSEWLKVRPPTLYVLPERPQFISGGVSPFGCAWFAWAHRDAREWAHVIADGRVHHLALRKAVELEWIDGAGAPVTLELVKKRMGGAS